MEDADRTEETSPQPGLSWPSAEEIYRMIREAAYLKAEARNFAPGVELDDWLAAEKEVLERLNASSPRPSSPARSSDPGQRSGR